MVNPNDLAQYTKEWLQELCKDSYSYAEVLQKAGRKPTGGNYSILKTKIRIWDIDVSHFTGKVWIRSPNKIPHRKSKYKPEEILIQNSPVTQKVLREYVRRNQIIKYECAFCGCDGSWLDKQISLELDHIDGDNSNNEVTNLRYLCPNCHATTQTYRGKNKSLKNKCVEDIHQQPKS